MKPIILVINPGSTSTKIALYSGDELLFNKNITHSDSELASFGEVMNQETFRRDMIVEEISKSGVELKDISLVIGRGGLVKSIPSGVYEVNEAMKSDLRIGASGVHASNLGGVIAAYIAEEIGVKAYIADPVVVDEMSDVARISGHPLLPRKSIFHALNQKAVSRSYAHKIGAEYENLNLIVVHMGGGVSVGAHKKGLVVDVNNALLGDGPFSCDRCGSVAAADVIDLAFSGDFTQNELKDMIIGKGGFMAHLGSNNAKDIEMVAISGNAEYKLILDAFIYNITKSIGAMSTVLAGKVDAIILTGGIAHSKYICDTIISHTDWIAKSYIHAGEDELHALAENALLVLEDKIIAKIYC